jgi:hypothetical protein
MNMIAKEKRPGSTTVYVLMPVSAWKPSEFRGQVIVAHRNTGDTCSRNTGDNYPSEFRGHKVTPIEVTPNKVNLSILSASERIIKSQSLQRASDELKELKDADLPKAIERRKELREEQTKLRVELGLKA